PLAALTPSTPSTSRAGCDKGCSPTSRCWIATSRKRCNKKSLRQKSRRPWLAVASYSNVRRRLVAGRRRRLGHYPTSHHRSGVDRVPSADRPEHDRHRDQKGDRDEGVDLESRATLAVVASTPCRSQQSGRQREHRGGKDLEHSQRPPEHG